MWFLLGWREEIKSKSYAEDCLKIVNTIGDKKIIDTIYQTIALRGEGDCFDIKIIIDEELNSNLDYEKVFTDIEVLFHLQELNNKKCIGEICIIYDDTMVCKQNNQITTYKN